MNEEESKIILISEFIEQRLNKEREIDRYKEEIVQLTKRITSLQRELDLTNLIITMIQQETVIDFKEYLIQKQKDRTLIESSSDDKL